MGGFGSGGWYRWSKKTYADDCRFLDVNRMVRLKAIPKCGWSAGSWIWTDKETGEKQASIGYEADTRDPYNAFLRLHYTLRDSQEKVDYKIRLVVSTPRHGGMRFWFICPYKGKRVSKLYLPCGGTKFASRHAYGLAYASQSECAASRATRKLWKLKHRIGGYDFPRRPKGMHERTYKRLFHEVLRIEDVVDWHFVQRFGAFVR